MVLVVDESQDSWGRFGHELSVVLVWMFRGVCMQICVCVCTRSCMLALWQSKMFSVFRDLRDLSGKALLVIMND